MFSRWCSYMILRQRASTNIDSSNSNGQSISTNVTSMLWLLLLLLSVSMEVGLRRQNDKVADGDGGDGSVDEAIVKCFSTDV